MRDHGGDLDRAKARFGEGDWLDLSTGINAVPYPLPELPPHAWTALPTRAEITALEAVARTRIVLPSRARRRRSSWCHGWAPGARRAWLDPPTTNMRAR